MNKDYIKFSSLEEALALGAFCDDAIDPAEADLEENMNVEIEDAFKYADE